MSEQVNVEENNEPKNIFKEVIEKPQEHDCSICHEQLIIDDPESTKFMKSWLGYKTCKFHKPVYVTSCNHAFHGACLSAWVKRDISCPVCRSRPQRLE